MQRHVQPLRRFVILALMLSGALAGCAPAAGSGPTAPDAPVRTLSGEVTYRQRVALPAGAVVTVTLNDVSLADAPATTLATATITTQGENVPIPFTLTYDPARIVEKHSYAVSARITIDGKLSWITATRHGVLTRGQPSDAVTIVLQPASAPASS